MKSQSLGSKPTAQPSKKLETFENPNIKKDLHVHMQIPEFTCLCPKTGQPDFATLYLDYIPDKRCVELKSLKLYIWSFRNEGCFHEAVTNQILKDLVKATKPRFMRLTAKFFVRGGIFTNVTVENKKKVCKAEIRGYLSKVCLTFITFSFMLWDIFFSKSSKTFLANE